MPLFIVSRIFAAAARGPLAGYLNGKMTSPNIYSGFFYGNAQVRYKLAFDGGFLRFTGHLRKEVIAFLQIGCGILP